MQTINKIHSGIWAGMMAVSLSSLVTPPIVVNAQRELVYVVAVTCKFPKRKKIKIKDCGMDPATFGKINQAKGKQKWNKK